MYVWKKALLGTILVIGLSGCLQSNAPVQTLPDITFIHMEPLRLNVATIETQDQSQAGMKGKHIEHLLPTSPKKAMNRWVQDRLRAVGTSGVARLTIVDASAIEEKLKKETGLKGVFTNDQSERYTTNIDVRLDLFDAKNTHLGYGAAKAKRYITLPENASLLEREKAWFHMVEALMSDFDRAFSKNIKTNLLKQ